MRATGWRRVTRRKAVAALADERGFTTIELALVLALVGLVIGGILGVQRILTYNRTNDVVDTLTAYREAARRYRAEYGALPGDDRGARARWGKTVPQAGGAADGRVQGRYNAGAPDRESRLFWAHLRAAGLIPGKPGDTGLPRNGFGGIYGVQEDPMELEGPAICVSNLTGEVAREVLTRMGPGERDQGDVRGIQLNGTSPSITGTPSPGPIPPLENELAYVLCARI